MEHIIFSLEIKNLIELTAENVDRECSNIRTLKRYFALNLNVYRLKGTVPRDFLHLFLKRKKNSTWARYEQAKSVLRNILFSRRYSRKFACVSA